MVHHPTDERRLVSRVIRHWREMATGRRFPSTVEIDPWIVGNDWEYCFVIRLRQEQQATFLMVGAALLPDAGTALEYKPIVMCPPNTVLATVLTHLSRCIADAAPLSMEGTTQHCGASVLFRAVLLPLADDGSHIDGMFGAVNYRAMKPGEEMAVRTRSEVKSLDVSVGQLWDSLRDYDRLAEHGCTVHRGGAGEADEQSKLPEASLFDSRDDDAISKISVVGVSGVQRTEQPFSAPREKSTTSRRSPNG